MFVGDDSDAARFLLSLHLLGIILHLWPPVLVADRLLPTTTRPLAPPNVPAGGGGGATNLAVTASPTGVTVTSDTGTDAAIPLANGTNAGLMAPAQHTKLGDLPTAGELTTALNGKADSSHTHSIGNVTGLATALNGKAAKAVAGTVGDSAVTLAMPDALLAGVPLTITVTPESTCTVLVESSSDNGITYTTVGSAVGVFEQWEYDRAPGETGWITNLRFTRTAGTATTSTYSIRS